jgi:formylglycine-generating enzyme required for sulfatase activity
VDIALPSEGVVEERVVLRLECVGRPATFLEPATTCVSLEQLSASPEAGRLDGAGGETSLVGTAALAQSYACEGPDPDASPCIAGGYSVLGDVDLAGIGDLFVDESLPLRPVVLSPFWMDETEMTVGRVRPLVQAGVVSEALPALYDPNDINQQFCSWRGADDATADTLPLNCVGLPTAAQICQLLGGQLPSEAQWEHAARGRGQHRSYPWGDDAPECCSLSAARSLGPCPGVGLEPVASHAPSNDCAVSDVSRDGVFDLGGSLVELVSDLAAPYGEGCWDYDGFLVDPSCATGDGPGARGGNWHSSFVQALSALRKRAIPGEGQGFRCVYPSPEATR